MRRGLFAGLLLASFAPALAASPEPSRTDIIRAAETCTADGAFAIKFGDGGKAQDISPFAVEQVSSRANGTFRVTARASFQKAPMSAEDRIALAKWVFGKLDAQAGKRQFAERVARPDGVTYFSAKEHQAGYALDISHDGTQVWIVCTALSMDPRAHPGRPDD